MVSGEVDLYTAPRLEEELRQVQRNGADVIVYLEQVEFMDCAGLGVLVTCARAASMRGSRCAVTRSSRQVQKLFELSGATGILEFVRSGIAGPMAA